MKKVISLLICLVLTFSISVCAFAAGNATVNSAASVDTAKLGDTITVTVSLKDSAAFKSIALTPSYDTAVFEMVSGEWLLTDAQIKDVSKTNAAIAYSTAVEKSGDIFKYELKVKDSAALANTTIKTDAVIKNSTTSINATIGSVTVKIICKTHTFDAWSKADDNNHKHTCSACGTVETVAHTWDSGKVTTAATCKAAGVKTFTCTACSATKTEAIAKTNSHTFGDWAQTKAPTCTENGTDSRTCSVCSKAETKDVAATGHTLGAWTTVTEATTEAKGLKKATCTVCSTAVEEEIPMLDKVDEPTDAPADDPVDDDASNGWILWVIIGAIALIIVILLVIILKKKNNKNSNGGNFTIFQ